MIARPTFGYVIKHADMGESVDFGLMTRMEMTEQVQFCIRDAIGIALASKTELPLKTSSILASLFLDL